jgi:periplasmic mercuric ion binding protein
MKKSTKFLSIVLSFFFLVGLTAGCKAQPKKEETIKIKTSAVCGQCKDRIENGLAYEKGIKDVSLDVETKIVTVKFTPGKTNPDAIRTSISKLGYDADNVLADKAAYDKLPSCCKKDAKKH